MLLELVDFLDLSLFSSAKSGGTLSKKQLNYECVVFSRLLIIWTCFGDNAIAISQLCFGPQRPLPRLRGTGLPHHLLSFHHWRPWSSPSVVRKTGMKHTYTGILLMFHAFTFYFIFQIFFGQIITSKYH